MPGFVILSPLPTNPLSSPLLSMGFPVKLDAKKIAAQLWEEEKLVVKVLGSATFPGEGGPEFPAHALRLSFHLYNTENDVDNAVNAIERILTKNSH